MLKKLLRVMAVLASLLALLALGVWARYRHGLPDTTPGDADALAQRMLLAVDASAWDRTGAVRWTFVDGARHLWDRARGFERYDKGNLRVLLNLSTRRGRAWRGGVALDGAQRDRALDTAWKRWVNDSFWLNPVVKAFDQGVVREVVRDDQGRASLLLTYRSGGVTPGDRYQWILGANDRPVAWRMWVSVLPIGGLEATWEDWQRLSTGAWISTRHRIGPIEHHIDNVVGAATIATLEPGPDPFALLAR